jgi:tRNA G18 (ribose-2'-O)-methylase SpoU
LNLSAPTILVLGACKPPAQRKETCLHPTSHSSCAGNEGYGLRASVRRECTMTTKIEHDASSECAHGAYRLDSLNVSVAAGILIHQLAKGRTTPP